MMATEPLINNPAAVSALPVSQLIPNVDQDANRDVPTVNGADANHEDIANKHITNVEDQANSADASVSGGSDTEVRQRDGDDKGHARSGSYAKKPATFKAVSVNRTFLASKASPTPGATKSADKPATGSSTPPPGSASLIASRPRLVAKTGSGSGGSLPRFSSTINGAKPASTPDPSVVWNKNRPAPPQEPKKFTDEELKKYGIHMASRLNEEDAQGQNKWADIDDDDDDWAPDAITWGDGTKTTLPQTDDLPAAALDNEPPAPTETSRPDMARSPPPPIAAQPILPPTKSSGLASGRGLVLKPAASQEKVALVAKPPPPSMPAKSPWATLPQVDKAPSMQMEQPHLGRQPLQDHVAIRSTMTSPPKEIAADDFNRSAWRENAPQANRELFNSQSGRYEPVRDRRGSFRIDQQSKHPSLLQRQNHQDQPAEPSSAFQTTRAAQDVPYGRRRGSSNASGGGGPFFQRSGKGVDGYMPPPDALKDRRESATGSTDSPLSPVYASASIHAQSRQQGPPLAWASRSASGAPSTAPHQSGPNDDVSMGQAQPNPPAQPPVDQVEYQKKVMREKIELARKRRQEEEAREEAERKERIQKKLAAMGPPPKKADKKETPPKAEPVKPVQIQQRGQSEAGETAITSETASKLGNDSESETLAKRTSVADPSRTNAAVSGGPPSRRLSQGQDGKRSDPWAGGSGPRPANFTPWAPGSQPQSRNVWGSPNNDHGLGNGTFDPDLGLLPGSTAAPAPTNGPSPIAPPSSSRGQAQGRQQQPPPPIGSRASRYGAPGSDLSNKWVASVAEGDKKLSATRLAERNSQERQLAQRGLTMEDVQPTIHETWRSVQVGDGARRVINAPEVQSQQPNLWKSARDDIANAAAPTDIPATSSAAGVIGSNKPILPQSGSAASSQPRQSRFFPAKDMRMEQGSSQYTSGRPLSPSLPPPTMEGHPAYEGDISHPHVSLPRPQPVVKLPPSMMNLQQAKHATAWATRGSNQKPKGPSQQPQLSPRSTEMSTGDWKDKIKNLLRPSPPKSLGIDAASRNSLDHAVHQDSTTVSLPGIPATAITTSHIPARTQRRVVSKPMAEECFEEQEMGSLPQIRLPHRVPDAAWEPCQPPPKPLPKKFTIQAVSLVNSSALEGNNSRDNSVKIQLPGMAEPKSVALPTVSSPRSERGSRGNRGSPRHRGSTSNSRGSKKEASNSGGGESSAGGSKSTRAGRGGRGRAAESWHRHPQPQQAQAQT